MSSLAFPQLLEISPKISVATISRALRTSSRKVLSNTRQKDVLHRALATTRIEFIVKISSTNSPKV
ncbi:MAG: hypothetical protein D6687_03540 [Acidobacteria bacterium]|nr:MAG: hypothetical protein D6687_03540 [Acidobacteriota bacterium]